MPRVCVIGSANLDYTVALPRLPRVGETVSAGTLLINRGGKGANQAVAARRLGAEVRMIGCVGDDEAGGDMRRGLAAEGIGVDRLATVPGVATGTALIFVDREGRNMIGVAPGANHSSRWRWPGVGKTRSAGRRWRSASSRFRCRWSGGRSRPRAVRG